MKTTYIIKPVGNVSAPILTCAYQNPENKSETKILTSDVDMETYNHNVEKNPPASISISFSRDRQEHRLYYEPDTKDPYQKKMNDVIENFYKKHPLFTVNGKKHQNTWVAQFDISSDSDRITASYTSWKTALDVAKMVDEMSDEKMRDACYYYGRSPKGMDRQQMTLLLADFNSGYGVKDIDQNGDSVFVNMFSSESDTERDFRISMQKALWYNIIENKMQGSRNNYYLGNEFIGTTENDVLAFLKREEKIYNGHILQKIKENDELNHGSVTSKQKKKNPADFA